ncbi:MAG TPA: hypothetical protein VFH87_07795 [Candidatus Udaeobacter sp.]|nr:hypothetical protein [Candidatus Udaeobacter sp.]
MIQYSDGTVVDTLFTSNGTRRQLIDQWETAVSTAGWSVVSGGGSADKVYESATTPDGFKIRVRAKDVGGNCAQFTLKDNGVLESEISYTFPVNTFPYRIWANKYQYFLFRSGTDMTINRAFVGMGVPWLSSFMVDYMQAFPYAGWCCRNGATDVDTNAVSASWRKNVSGTAATGPDVWRGTAFASNNKVLVGPALPTNIGLANYVTWEDGTHQLCEPLLVVPRSGGSSYMVAGQLWDSVLNTKPYDSEAVRQITGKSWRVLTHQAATATQGTLMLLTNI